MKRLAAGLTLALAAGVACAQMQGGVMESQKQGTAAITSGTINGATIGATTPKTGVFTTVGVGTSAPQSMGFDVSSYLIGIDASAGGSIGPLGLVSDTVGRTVRFTDSTKTYTGGLSVLSSRLILAASTAGLPLSFESGGAEQLRLGTTASAVNYGQVAGSTSTNPVIVSAQGTDATITLQLAPKSSSPNAGAVLVKNSGTGATAIRTAQTTAPTCTTNCGTSPSVAGTDSAGIVTMGSSGVPASGWVVTFNGTWSAVPACIVQSALATMVVGKMPIAVVATTTTLTVTTNGTAPATSDKYQYICIGVS